MDCLIDTSCLTSLLDTLNQLTAAVDFCGLVLFGDVWSPIAPGVEAGVKSLAQFFNPIWLGDESSCIQYASLVSTDA